MDKYTESPVVNGAIILTVATVTAVVMVKKIVPAVERKLVRHYLTHTGPTKN